MTSHSPVFPLTPYLCRWIVMAGSREENSVIYGVEQHCIRISTDWSWKLGQDLHMSFGLKFWYYKFKRFSQSSNMNYQLPCFMALYIPLSQDLEGNLFQLRNKHEEHCITGTGLHKCCLTEMHLTKATRSGFLINRTDIRSDTVNYRCFLIAGEIIEEFHKKENSAKKSIWGFIFKGTVHTLFSKTLLCEAALVMAICSGQHAFGPGSLLGTRTDPQWPSQVSNKTWGQSSATVDYWNVLSLFSSPLKGRNEAKRGCYLLRDLWELDRLCSQAARIQWRRGGEEVTQHSGLHINAAQAICSVATSAWQEDYYSGRCKHSCISIFFMLPMVRAL